MARSRARHATVAVTKRRAPIPTEGEEAESLRMFAEYRDENAKDLEREAAGNW